MGGKEIRVCYERLRPAEMDLPLPVPVSGGMTKDALSNHISQPYS